MSIETTDIELQRVNSPNSRATMRAWAIALFIAAVFYFSISPTLTWVQFHDPIENLNVATAMEMRHGGPWLVPNLQGVPRLAKPPLTAWLSAISIRPETMAALDATEPAARAAAYDRLMAEVRRPALLSAALMLIAVYWIGHLASGQRAGVFAACVCGTQWLILRHAQLSSTDIQLALWVAVANAFLALCVFRRRRWIGCIGAGVALGLVFMAKGPVGLVQTLLPFAAFVWIARRRKSADRANAPWRTWIAPAIVGLLLMLVVGLWWYVRVAMQHSHMFSFWFSQVSRVEADEVPAGHWYKHLLSMYLTLPWMLWVLIGVAIAVRALRRREAILPSLVEPSAEPSIERGIAAAVLGLLLWLVPLLVMSFAKDRFQRYLVPLWPATALLAAGALVEYARGRINGLWLSIVHWVTVGTIAIGLPIVMWVGKAKSFRSVDGSRLLGGGAVLAIVLGAVGMIALAITLQRRRRDAIVWMSALIMLGANAVYYKGLGKTEGGRCELAGVADGIAADYPNAQLWVLHGNNPNVISVYGNELSIYLNRPVNFARSTDLIPPADRTQVLLLVRGKRDPRIDSVPGWTRMKALFGGNAKYVFVRNPGAQP